MFDLCIIGAGLFGSSSAKHACKKYPNLKVALIGPPENQSREGEEQIFGSWFDAGRLYSMLHLSPEWANLARESILQFETVKQESGENFYTDAGYLEAATKIYNDFEAFNLSKEELVKRGFECLQERGETIGSILPFLNLPKDAAVHYQIPIHKNAGYLNPRQLVKAQQKIASTFGCKIIPELVQTIQVNENEAEKTFSLVCKSGLTIQTKKVLIATGIYSGLLPLIREASEGKFELEMTFTAQVVALIESDQKMKELLSLMPTMVTYFDPAAYTYILPPIAYPNGKLYMKFGCHDKSKNLKTLEEVTDYFVQGPDKEKVQNLVNYAHQIIPELKATQFEGMSCVTCNTPGKRAPFIDRISKGVYLATGGCGEGAATCEEIGRIAATLAVEDIWDSEIDRKVCSAKLRKIFN